MSIKLDFHVHTKLNGKKLITTEQLSKGMRQSDLYGVAITNFHELEHAISIREAIKDRIIIVGQEIISNDGHIIGLGLNKKIADLRSAEETIESIHKQSGIAIAPHPFIPSGIGKKVATLPFDAIEVYNSIIGKMIIPNYLAKRQASKAKITPLASTDTSDYRYIGWSYTEVLTDEPKEIFNAIVRGEVKLKKRGLPLPIIHILKSILGFSDIESWSLHQMFCYICGKSVIFKIVRKKYLCLDCGNQFLSRIICCNGHYLCNDCTIKRNSYNSRSRTEYTMPCKILKKMPDGRLKILVFGERWNRDNPKTRIRYVHPYRIHEVSSHSSHSSKPSLNNDFKKVCPISGKEGIF